MFQEMFLCGTDDTGHSNLVFRDDAVFVEAAFVFRIWGEGAKPVVDGDQAHLSLTVQGNPVAFFFFEEVDVLGSLGSLSGTKILQILDDQISRVFAKCSHVFLEFGIEGSGISIVIYSWNDKQARS